MPIPESLHADLIELRHALHRQPEIAFKEIGTARYVSSFISAHSRNVSPAAEEIGGNGLLYMIEGTSTECGDGDSISNSSLLFVYALDGSPIPDETGVPYESERPWVSHGIGNDGHCSIGAGLVVLLSQPEIKSQIKGKIYVLFQSAGQVGGSYRTMSEIQERNLLNLDTTMTFHCINVPGQPLGTNFVALPDTCAALASLGMEIKITGLPAHAATPDQGENPMLPLIQLARDIEDHINANNVDDDGEKEKYATFVSMHVDTQLSQQFSVVYATAAALGTLNIALRARSRRDLDAMKEYVEARGREIVGSNTDLTIEFTYSEVFGAVYNDPMAVLRAKKASEKAGTSLEWSRKPLKWSNDIWRFLCTGRGGAMVCSGAGDIPALQDPKYDFPDQLIPPVLELTLAICLVDDCENDMLDHYGITHKDVTVPLFPPSTPVITFLDRSNEQMGGLGEVAHVPAANCCIEIDRNALESNTRNMIEYMGNDVAVVAVVKGNCYGMGYGSIPIFEGAGMRRFAVANVIEARNCIAAFTRAESTVQIISPFGDSVSACWIVGNREWVIPWIGTEEIWPLLSCELGMVLDRNRFMLDMLKPLVSEHMKPLTVHVEIETGLNRTGIQPDRVIDLCRKIQAHPLARLGGVCTHLAGAEMESNLPRIRKQIEVFDRCVAELKAENIEPEFLHVASSSAAIVNEDMRYNMVRVGVALSGCWPTNEVSFRYKLARITAPESHPPLELTPVLSWKSTVIHIHRADHGFVGYGDSRHIEGPTDIGIVPVGYSDGFTTALGNVGHVLIHGRRCMILGHVNMSVLMVNVTHINESSEKEEDRVRAGSEVVLIGKQGDEAIRVASFAEASFVNYELLTRLARDIPRIIVGY